MLFCLWDGAYNRPVTDNRKVAHVAAAGFLSHYLNGHLPHIRCHITINKNFLPSFLSLNTVDGILYYFVIFNNKGNSEKSHKYSHNFIEEKMSH